MSGGRLKPAAFAHHQPGSVADAARLLSDLADRNVRIIAGGQSLAPMMAFRLATPDHLIDINGVKELDFLEVGPSELRIGALVRHKNLERIAGAGATGDLLGLVLPWIAHFPIRSRGTFCGSIAHADPASEWCLVSVALDARMVLVGAEGVRAVAACDFFEGPMSTNAKPSELLREVRLPLLPNGTRMGFQEFSRRRGDFALSMALATYRVEDGLIRDPRIAIGGAEDRPRRFASAEALLVGQAPSAVLFAAASQRVAEELQPMEGPGTTAEYRRELTRTLTLRALEEAAR